MRFHLTALFWIFSLGALTAAPWPRSGTLDAIVEDAIANGEAPGAVLLVGRGGAILHHKAYGKRSLIPAEEAMTAETIFDCASLTKVVCTTPAVMMLVEQGKLRLRDPVTEYLPGFAGGQTEITLQHLLTHYSGLRPDLDLEPQWSGYETGIELAYQEKPVAPPGSRFIYSDINYILLAEIVRQLTGRDIAQFCRERILEPLGMADSGYLPGESLRARIAPTERLTGGTILRGVVHDPTTRYMGGVSGHAGLFSTAADLSRFARMMLNGGRLGETRLLSPLSIAKMTTPQSPPEHSAVRGLGWDLNSPYASVRGDLFPLGSFGHTGFTGTSMWMDPLTGAYVILMTNRVHPDRNRSVAPLRSKVASAAAAAFDDVPLEKARLAEMIFRGMPAVGGLLESSAPTYPQTAVLTGLDQLVREGFERLRGKRVGLITNHTGVDRRRRRNIDLFFEAEAVKLAAIFSPEHGIAGRREDNAINDAVDEATGTPIYSLYQAGRRRPTPEMLAGIDALVFDIQDIGARFYTYATTMAYAMEEAAALGIPFYVLDRPNPINGVDVAGPLLDGEFESFVGYFRMPVRHGMTVGELARMFNAERKIGAGLTVVAMEGWRRELFFDQTGLPWVDPSPNIRTLNQALLYPGIALLEGLPNYSVGRGTDTPFEFIGADWMDAARMASELNSRGISGVSFYEVRRTPRVSHFAGETIPGLQITVLGRERLRPLALGLEIACAIQRLHPGAVEWEKTARLVGDRETLAAIAAGEAPGTIAQRWRREVTAFLAVRSRYLLY